MSDTQRALTAALVDWVVKGTEPPRSRYPMLADNTLVTPLQVRDVFPAIPGVRMPQVNLVLDYDFGATFAYQDMTGVIAQQPPAIRRVLATLVPRVDRDGNEVVGVASPLHQAPLGSYLGWNITTTGAFKGQICGFAGGYVPFAVTQAERTTSKDPRPSLEERYGTQEGYVCVVERAVEASVRDRFLLRVDADRLLSAVRASKILPLATASSDSLRQIGEARCR
jgi:hypothetical protein